MSRIFSVVMPKWRDDFPEVHYTRGKTPFSPEVTKVVCIEDLIEFLVERCHHTMHVVCSNSDSPCGIKDMSKEDIVVIEVRRRDKETGEVEVGIILAIEAFLFVNPDVNKVKGALDESRSALPFQ